MWIIRNKRLVFTPTPTPTPTCSLTPVPDCDFELRFTPTPTTTPTATPNTTPTSTYGPDTTPTGTYTYSPLQFSRINKKLNFGSINQKYNTPKTKDMAVCIAFFSPVNSNRLFENYKKVKSKLDEADIPNFTIHLYYDKPILRNCLSIKSNSIMFHKENLWNILGNKISKRYDKLMFLDGDIIFTNPNWYEETSNLLRFNDIVQPYEVAAWQGKDESIRLSNPCSAQFIGLGQDLDFSKSHPGFAWAMNRKTFDEINGFYEHQVLGAGDALFGMALNKQKLKSNHYGYHKSLIRSYNEYLNNISNYNLNIDYLNDCDAIHLYHGELSNRNYGGKEIPPSLDLTRNENGLLDWKNNEMNEMMIRNFSSRKEDL